MKYIYAVLPLMLVNLTEGSLRYRKWKEDEAMLPDNTKIEDAVQDKELNEDTRLLLPSDLRSGACLTKFFNRSSCKCSGCNLVAGQNQMRREDDPFIVLKCSKGIKQRASCSSKDNETTSRKLRPESTCPFHFPVRYDR